MAALVLALADLGALGIEGIEAYNQEGSLIFLEENPDIVSVIFHPENQKYLSNFETSEQAKQEPYENVRQRLLKRARFQVDFAKGRLKRFDREVASLPEDAIYKLKIHVFKYLNLETIQEIELTTPTKNDTTLKELIEFFRLEHYLRDF